MGVEFGYLLSPETVHRPSKYAPLNSAETVGLRIHQVV